jgi:hypothetical protein
MPRCDRRRRLRRIPEKGKRGGLQTCPPKHSYTLETAKKQLFYLVNQGVAALLLINREQYIQF